VLSLRADKTVGSSSGELSDQGALLFSAVFVIVWLGATVITINALLLGGKMYVVVVVRYHSLLLIAKYLSLICSPRNSSFFQSCCVFGYCIFPIMVASLITWAWANIYFRLLVCVLAVVWSAAASVGFMANLVPPHRKILAVYPVLLFYSVLGWMVLIQA